MAKVINLPGDLITDRNIEGIAPSATEKLEEKAHRQAVLMELGRINTLLQVILNHQRVITGIESENEGDF